MTWHPDRRLLTVEEAAESVDRPASTVRRWITERRLLPQATWRGRPLLLEADVLRVDAETRRRRPRLGA